MRWRCTLLAALFWLGCAEAPAQEPARRIEHGVFRYLRFQGDRNSETYAWATAEKEATAENAVAFFEQIGLDASVTNNESDRVRVLDHLAAQGWEVVDRTDVVGIFPGGSGIAERHLLRRRR